MSEMYIYFLIIIAFILFFRVFRFLLTHANHICGIKSLYHQLLVKYFMGLRYFDLNEAVLNITTAKLAVVNMLKEVFILEHTKGYIIIMINLRVKLLRFQVQLLIYCLLNLILHHTSC